MTFSTILLSFHTVTLLLEKRLQKTFSHLDVKYDGMPLMHECYIFLKNCSPSYIGKASYMSMVHPTNLPPNLVSEKILHISRYLGSDKEE